MGGVRSWVRVGGVSRVGDSGGRWGLMGWGWLVRGRNRMRKLWWIYDFKVMSERR